MTMPHTDKPPAQKWAPLFLGMILLTTFFTYLNAIHGELQFDDDTYINPKLNLASQLSSISSHFWSSLISGRRLLTDLSFGLNHALDGLAVEGYHLVNILLHLCVVALVYFFLQGMIRRLTEAEDNARGLDWLPLLATAIFALHPLQTQAVSYIVQRAEILGSLFYLLTLIWLLRFVEAPRSKMLLPWSAALAFFILGWVSKQIIVTAPAALLIYALFFLDRQKIRRAVWGCIPFLLGGGIAGLKMVSGFTVAGGAGYELEGLHWPSYALTQLRVFMTYLRLIFWPAGQNLDYDYPIYHSLWDPEILLCSLFWLAVLTLITLGLRRRAALAPPWRLAGFGMSWFLLLLLPTSSVIPLADVINEHRLYLALAGPLISGLALSGLLWQKSTRFLGKNSRRIVITATILCLLIVLGSLSIATRQRNLVWQTKMSLWQDVVAKSPNKSRPHNNLGNCYYLKNDLYNALPHYERAVELDPKNIEAYYNIGLIYTKVGNHQKANQYYELFKTKSRQRYDR